MVATQQLKEEHEGIKTMLRILEKMMADFRKNDELNADHLDKVIDFIKGFADSCHHGKEEDILFPAMEKHGIPKEGGPIAVMLHEHDLGRQFIRGLYSAFEKFKVGKADEAENITSNAAGYIALLRNHIDKENNILFPMADRFIGVEDQEELFDAFEKIEVEKIGVGKHEEYHRLLHELSDIYLK